MTFRSHLRRSKQGAMALRVASFAMLLATTAISSSLAAEALPGESCADVAPGTFRQSSGPEVPGAGHMLVCDGTNWQPVLSYNDDGEVTTIGNQSCGNGDVLTFNSSIWTCGAGGGGSGLWEDTGTIIRPSSGLVDYATRNFLFGSPSAADGGNPNYYHRIYFDKAKGAFRAGDGSWGWDAANIGDYSVAFGRRNRASGVSAAAFGYEVHASGPSSFVTGQHSGATGIASFAAGQNVFAQADRTIALGRSINVEAQNSIGLSVAGSHLGARPRMTHSQSIGMFMGNNQADVVFSAANTLGVFGGRMILDPANPATKLSVSTGTGGQLALDVEGNIGAQNYCDADGNNCFTAADVGGGSSLFERSGTVVRPSSAVTISTDDFVFGSHSLDDVAGTDDDNRMFFNKSKGAFRAGISQNTRWDASTANVGMNSTAFGYAALASGDRSMAWGTATASGFTSTAWGSQTTANQDHGTAWGEQTISSGRSSTAWGTQSTASSASATAWGGYFEGPDYISGGTAAGMASTAWGIGSHAGSYTETSLGRYPLNTAGTPGSWVATDTLFEIGNGTASNARANAVTVLKNGNVGIGTAAPSSGTGGPLKLDVEGNVGAQNYCDADGNNCFTATDVGGEGSSLFERSGTVVRPSSAVTIATDDFVFGSHSLDNVAGDDDDNRMFFDKSKGAFRVGYGGGTNWNASTASVGAYSMAWGPGGAQTTKIANTASGTGSTAWGGIDGYSTPNTASGDFSTAWGSQTNASGVRSTAWGNQTNASGAGSTVWGTNSNASNHFSTAWGMYSIASGRGSTAWGDSAHAGSFIETSLGRYPLNTAGNTEGWIATDTLFEIGIGTNNANRANALTVLKNGNVGIGTASPQSALHIPDGKYLQIEDNNAGAPPQADCDNDSERGRMSIDTQNARLYVCMGGVMAGRWGYVQLTVQPPPP